MIRANWTIETILEVQEEYKKGVSPELISNITKNLFEVPDKPANSDAALALKALLGFTALEKFGTDRLLLRSIKRMLASYLKPTSRMAHNYR